MTFTYTIGLGFLSILVYFCVYVRDVFGSFPAQAHEILTYANNIHFNIHAFEAIWSVYVRYVFLHRLLEFDFEEGSFDKAVSAGLLVEALSGTRKTENESGVQKCSKQ